MANKKISQLTPKGSALAGTDLLEVSVFNGATYDTKSLTGANVVSGLQPTLVSGTNIKTINSTSLLGSGNIVISTGLTVGTTPITSGTDTRLLFQNGGVVQQSANFTYDASLGLSVGNNTVGFVKTSTQNISGANVGELTTYSLNNFPLVKLTGGDLSTYFSGRIGLYYGNTEKAYLKASATGGEIGGFNSLLLKAQGALSTDIALRVRNSADNFNILEQRGNGTSIQLVNSTTITPKIGNNIGGANTDLWFNAKTVMSSGTGSTGFHAEASGKVMLFTEYGNASGGGSGSGHLWHDPIGGSAYFNFGEDLTNGLGIRMGAISAGSFQPAGAWLQVAKYGGTWAQSVVSIGTFLGATTTTSPATNLGGNTFRILTGASPTADYADTFCLYSADITAGNAAPHFRTENGNVIKIYQQTTAVTSATVVSGSGGNVKHDDTFDGYTVEQVVRALRNTGLLA